MKKTNIIIYIVICLIIVAGVAMWYTKGFNLELQYSARKQIRIDNKTGMEISEIENIANEVLGETKHFVQTLERFGNSVLIVSEEMTEEQKNQIVEKINEKYSDAQSAEDVTIESIPFTRIKDAVKKYIAPGVITLGIILIYFIIRFRKISVLVIILKTLIIPVVSELTYFSLISICRIPFSRATLAIGVVLYVMVMLILANIFENKEKELKGSQENGREGSNPNTRGI